MEPRGRTATRVPTNVPRWLIWTHRYVGIPLSTLFVLWFASGIVMMYTGDMPPADGGRAARLPGAARSFAGPPDAG